MYIGLHVKYRYSCQILMKLEFVDRFPKNTRISSFMKIRVLGAELFHTDGQTDRDVTKLMVAFRKFSNASNNMKQSMRYVNTYLLNMSG
jgi:hypothetical protein